MYKEAMGELHCLSSQSRLEEFKSALSECRIQAVEANYFSREVMDNLIKILVEEDLEVAYSNISNVFEYTVDFYLMNPFNGLVQGMESTSSLSDLSVRSEDCKKLRIKISVSEENSELFDEETGIFRPIYCNRSRTVLSPTGC
ncbi:hypothetical protein [Endozoicomonas sp. 8E]|uniref:hypothetical protein n=1 Tax=Endozoicomonas sp. 8E TaxID=3035692 RepID=UPI002938FCC0|nr:hypothetical protein [Endozoicomonas sp. 8E]WOG28972.1 hypothetical protein P6910_04725 [Endozoicomonas sp. 8E]